jgi:hypothetical protein
MRVSGELRIELKAGGPSVIANTAFNHLDGRRRKKAFRLFQIPNQVRICLEQMKRQLIEIERRNQTKGAQTKIGATVEGNTPLRKDRGGQLDVIGLEAPLQKNIPDLWISQVDITFCAVIKLNPLIVGSLSANESDHVWHRDFAKYLRCTRN